MLTLALYFFMSYIWVVMNYLTTKETAEKLGISTGRVRQMILAGQLEAEKFGRDLMIKENDIQAVENRKTGRPPKKAENKNGKSKPFKTIFDVAPELVGCIDSGLPIDLSCNKEYLKDLGKKSAEKLSLPTKVQRNI